MVGATRCQVRLFYSVVAFLALASASGAEFGVTLQWDANPEPTVAGYHAYVGTQSGRYDRIIDAGTETIVRIAPLDPGVTYYFAVTAYTDDHLESPFSDEIAYAVRINGTNAMLQSLTLAMTNAGTSVSISFNVKPGRHYLVQATTDLQTWQTLESFLFGISTAVIWNDPETSMHPLRFYRVVTVLP